MMRLYDYWRSSAAYRVRIALNLKGLPYEAHSVHLAKDGGQQHQSDYKALNPQGLVPLLTDGEFRLNQSLAIIEFLEDNHPTPALLPADPQTKAQVRAFSQVIACDIHPLDNLRVLQYLTGPMEVNEEKKLVWYQHWILEGFKALEQMAAGYADKGPYCFGEHVTMADVCLIPQVYNANRFNCPMTNFPRLREINDNCLKLDAFQKATPEQQADAT
ncbi:maleylacetoacetate isomerase [Hahella sp. CR1]|uniref:maleylacetoacetate isomerase n=1 Tax=Hahella sp. CR1 TaxID=2992807 RepID=UPI00244169CC|nr:maleylacetoacetate isomerase [Hahella sp. CR1]MDG9669088.1 maleylacetoacetate isomerase [Hahella sp. CR1]